MSRRAKIIMMLAVMSLWGYDACYSAQTASWGWVAFFVSLFAIFSWDLYALLWPRKPSQDEIIRPRWKL